jgi:hypothetical protein
MYHAMRAVSYIANGGDDHQEHSVLPTELPSDLPHKAALANSLKNARLSRNAADYDPYPTASSVWRKQAELLKTETKTLMSEAKQYLVSKGCIL